MGVGIRVDITKKLVLGVEAGARPIFSDRLDGVRINGDPQNDDWYYFGGATVSFNLDGAFKRR
jgi:hypothetical protein